MLKIFDELTNSFRRAKGEISYEAFERIVKKYTSVLEDSYTIFMLLQASGYPIEETLTGYRLKTIFTPWQEQDYCIVDIETNGSKPGRSQVIEIGAVKLRGREFIDGFKSFVSCAYLPEHIVNLTGIIPEDLKDAPSRKTALTKLREFLGDSIFVAHNAKFDYEFLNASFQRFGLGQIGNPVICTIDLAKRTFESEKYGLAYLNEKFDLGLESHHRAYDDAYATSKILLKSFEKLPNYVKTADDLVKFSKSSKKERKESSK